MQLPAGNSAGEHVLSFRYDAEQKPQVRSACASLQIVWCRAEPVPERKWITKHTR